MGEGRGSIILAEISGPPFECVQMALIINFEGGIKYFRGVQIFQVKVDGGPLFLGGGGGGGVQIYRYRNPSSRFALLQIELMTCYLKALPITTARSRLPKFG